MSLKIRVTGGCFHREHSPRAYAMIDSKLRRRKLADQGIVFEEHESGPELLAWVLLGTAAVQLVKELVSLTAAIVKARSEGIQKGDSPREPLEIIIRGIHPNGDYKEQSVLRIEQFNELDEKSLERQIDQAIGEMFGERDAET